MKPVLDVVRETIRRYDLARSNTRVVVALSGGSDEMRERDRIGSTRQRNHDTRVAPGEVVPADGFPDNVEHRLHDGLVGQVSQVGQVGAGKLVSQVGLVGLQSDRFVAVGQVYRYLTGPTHLTYPTYLTYLTYLTPPAAPDLPSPPDHFWAT